MYTYVSLSTYTLNHHSYDSYLSDGAKSYRKDTSLRSFNPDSSKGDKGV